MNDKNKTVVCDTGFFIRLVGESGELHDSACAYFKYFLENEYTIRMSTISIAEFCVKDTVLHLPLKNLMISPFNITAATYSGQCAAILLDEKAKGVREVNGRNVILNDVKIMAQAQCENADYYITSDTNSKRMYDLLMENNKVSYQFINLRDPCNQTFGVLDFNE